MPSHYAPGTADWSLQPGANQLQTLAQSTAQPARPGAGLYSNPNYLRWLRQSGYGGEGGDGFGEAEAGGVAGGGARIGNLLGRAAGGAGCGARGGGTGGLSFQGKFGGECTEVRPIDVGATGSI